LITDATKDITDIWMRKVAKYLRAERLKLGKNNLDALASPLASSERRRSWLRGDGCLRGAS